MSSSHGYPTRYKVRGIVWGEGEISQIPNVKGEKCGCEGAAPSVRTSVKCERESSQCVSEVSVAVSIVESRQVGVLTSYIPSVAASPRPMVPPS